jgi:hypothetical protein
MASSMGDMRKVSKAFGGIVRLRAFLLESCGFSLGEKSKEGLFMACTSGLVGTLMTKLDDKLLPSDGARDRLRGSLYKDLEVGGLGEWANIGDQAMAEDDEKS